MSKIITEKSRKRAVLRRLCCPVMLPALLPAGDKDWTDTQKLADELAAMLAMNPDAVGLAAPQIGAPVRLIAVRTDFEHNSDIIVLANPVVDHSSGWRMLDEGCLSLPGRRFLVQRSQTVCVRGFRMSDHTMVKLTARGNALAQALEHELDHLDGVLISDKGRERDPEAKIIDPWKK